METTAATSTAKEKLLSSLDGFQGVLSPATPSVAEALLMLDKLEVPTTRVEDWKYTRTARLTNEPWKLATTAQTVDPASWMIPGLETDLVVFVDGCFRADLSVASPRGFTLLENEFTPTECSFDNVFTALNVARATGCIQLNVPKNSVLIKTIHFLHIQTTPDALSMPVLDVHIESGAQAHIVETFGNLTTGKTLQIRTACISVAPNAQLTWDKVQMESAEHFLLNNEQVHLSDDARFTINTLTIDGQWVRNNLSIALDGGNIEANLNGCYLPREGQFVDNHTKVDHRKAHSNSHELYKGVLNGQSTGVFNGKVYVRQDAQKTNAYQSNANVLLSDDAQMNTKPELEIYADDVKCSHGTTTGQMDENAIFYLRSRGMSVESAQRLLTSAFIVDVMNKVKSEPVRSYVLALLEERGLLNQ
jgi:Fe-S cluster assembly protein SufD